MPAIEDLVEDIYGLFKEPKQHDPRDIDAFAGQFASMVANRLRNSAGPALRISNLGTKCARQLWYKINKPELAEPLSPQARFKFLIGDIHEAVLLFLAKLAGHEVTREQEEVNLHGVVGHIDAVIDGTLVDIKSASSQSFIKFTNHLTEDQDDFGYLTQLGAYQEATGSEEAAFLAVDKQLGSLCLDTHDLRGSKDWQEFIREKRETLSSPQVPERGYEDQPEGKSGNRKLGTACSYCAFKHECWPGLRTFYYSKKPVHLTVVKREPRVEEITAPEPV